MAAGRATARSPAPEASRAPEPARAYPQFSLRMSRPDDAAEREAEQTADRVMAMPDAVAAPRQRVSLITAPQLASAPAPRPAGARPQQTGPGIGQASGGEGG